MAALAGGDGGLDELLERRILFEAEPGIGAFRHALVRETVYGDVPWGRRRALHRGIAERLGARDGPPGLIAEHWSAAHEPDRARRALIAAVEAFCAIHAYRDAARAAGRALALWPEELVAERLETVGGVAPSEGCAPSDAEAELAVEYTATYVFYVWRGDVM